jgi:hypothetical protein
LLPLLVSASAAVAGCAAVKGNHYKSTATYEITSGHTPLPLHTTPKHQPAASLVRTIFNTQCPDTLQWCDRSGFHALQRLQKRGLRGSLLSM